MCETAKNIKMIPDPQSTLYKRRTKNKRTETLKESYKLNALKIAVL